jgi:ankyrin repeat protein
MMDKAGQNKLNSALIKAVRGCDLPLAKKALAAGADVNACDESGESVLFFLDDLPMQKMLLAAGADTDFQNKDGQTPLMLAILLQDFDFIEILAAKTNLELKDKNGRTALHYAVDMNATTIMQTLLAAGADVNSQDRRGETPLMLALGAWDMDMEGINALLACSPDFEIEDEWKYTALTHAIRSGETERVQALADMGVNFLLPDDDEGVILAELEDDKKMQSFLEKLRTQALERELSVYKTGLSRPLRAAKPLKPKGPRP